MSAVAAPAPPRVLADLAGRPLARSRALLVDAGLIVAGVAVMALLAKVSFFIGPVPITGQTAGVILVGAALGARRGAASLGAYALVGLAGLPVFAGPLAGPAYILSPSFGFIVGFIPAAWLAGWFAERAWDRHPARAFLGFVAASVVPFLFGVPYLALILGTVLGQSITFASVMDAGVVPFLLPGLFKAAVVALLLPGAWALVRSVDRSR